ncbi:MAG: hypothetical protein K2X62_12845 [Beijerinckiaceae bacterium]|nr:hypothetical protein [Beijerinckiaceae bacterium]MDO9442090.1 hypothetical protein [Beijerinckiaceae bacterium]
MAHQRTATKALLHTGLLALAALGASLASSGAAMAQYEEIRPGDRIVYVRPGTLEPLEGRASIAPYEGNVRRLRRVEDDQRLVYEYEGESRARQRLVIDPQHVVRDIQRVKKPKAKPRNKTVKQVATKPQAVQENVAGPPLTDRSARPDDRAAPAQASPAVKPASVSAPAIEPGQTRPRDDRNVRVIPLYKQPQTAAGEAPSTAR